MSHLATAVYVMIASPSDVSDARNAVYTALARWNESNTQAQKIALIPLGWETGVVPTLGDDPQAIINRQLLDRADIVFALFGSRLGRATPQAVSGTVEEIEKAEDAGKPVHLYFSTSPHPNDVEPSQLQALRDFRTAVEPRGLYGTFGSPEELTAHVWQAITHDLNHLNVERDERTTTVGVDFLAQPGEEREPSTDSRGRLRYQTRHWVDLTNRGVEDAHQVTIEAVRGPIRILSPEDPVTIHAGQTRRLPMAMFMGAGEPVIKVSWLEGEEVREREFHVG